LDIGKNKRQTVALCNVVASRSWPCSFGQHFGDSTSQLTTRTTRHQRPTVHSLRNCHRRPRRHGHYGHPTPWISGAL